MKKINLLSTILFGLLYPGYLAAQLYTGYTYSSWAGVSAVAYNPAIADNKMRLDIALGGFNGTFNNNLLGIGGTKVFDNQKMWGEFMNPDLTRDALLLDEPSFRIDGKTKRISKYAHIEMPLSFMVTLGPRNYDAIAITYHINSIKNYDNLNESAARMFIGRYNNSAQDVYGTTQSLAGTSIKSMAWTDYGITYSRVVLDKDEHFLKIGATLKYLQGLGAFYMQTDDASLTWRDNNDVDLSGNFNYAHSTDFLVTDDSKFNYKHISKPSFGGDIGLVYEWRPDKKKYSYSMDGNTLTRKDLEIYTLAFGFSIIDMGAIKYKRDNASYNFSTNLVGYNPNQFTTPNGVFSLNDSIARLGTKNSTDETFTMYLPTRFNIYLDYNIIKGFHLNASSTVSLDMTKKKNQLHYITTFSLTPRWEMNWFGVAMPLSADVNKNFGLGLSFRAGPVYFGTQNVISLALKKTTNLNLYAGVRITIPYMKAKDRDNDGVSDKMDQCITVAGTWPARGCPDTDGDGIKDEIDSCYAQAGPAATFGCPDSDKDGIIDKYDPCPNDIGTPGGNGCPDQDGDGVYDKDDDCVTAKGSAALHGCPDLDGDGVSDKYDQCIDEKGPVEHEGCPDTDGDGVHDNMDEDKYVKGPVENHGAPWGDQDDDGVLDNVDLCKTLAGPKALNGCPTVKTLAKMANESLYGHLLFEKGEYTLKASHKQQLDQLVKTMSIRENATSSVLLVGYTDNLEGVGAGSETLSEWRVNEAKKYVLMKGLNPDRLAVQWFGDADPVGDNSTEAGRIKNRRVTIKVVQIMTDQEK